MERRVALGLALVRNPRASPRAAIAAPHCAADEADGLALVTGSSVDLEHEAVIPCPAPEPSPPPPSHGSASLVRYEPETVVVDTKADGDAVLVLNDAYFPGWTATLDGTDAAIVPANHAVRGIRVPQGQHHVELAFHTPGLVAGAWISGAGWLVALALLWRGRERRSSLARMSRSGG
jgi:hypothetical protein